MNQLPKRNFLYKQECSDQLAEKLAQYENLDAIIDVYKTMIFTVDDEEYPLGKLTRFKRAIDKLDTLSRFLQSKTKNRIEPQLQSWLITVRKQLAITYCLLGSIFRSETPPHQIIVRAEFISHELYQTFTLISGFIEIMIHNANEPKPELDQLLPSFSESSLDDLAERLANVVPRNSFSEQRMQTTQSFNESDREILLKMKVQCDEITNYFETIWLEVSQPELEIRLF